MTEYVSYKQVEKDAVLLTDENGDQRSFSSGSLSDHINEVIEQDPNANVSVQRDALNILTNPHAFRGDYDALAGGKPAETLEVS